MQRDCAYLKSLNQENARLNGRLKEEEQKRKEANQEKMKMQLDSYSLVRTKEETQRDLEQARLENAIL